MGGLGILLLAVGAVLAFATNITVEGFDLEMIGIIFMVVGVLAVILGAVRGHFWGFTSRTERISSDGNRVIEQTTTD